jgi:hypothetical protein
VIVYAERPLPTQVCIGHLTYELAMDQAAAEKQSVRDSSSLAGFSSMSTQRLVLAQTNRHGEPLAPGYVRDTLLHEVLHLCLRSSGCDPDGDARAGVSDIEERAVVAISGPLLGALRGNPELLAYLIEGPA